ncbi:ABC transporter ATP-binding protein [Streptomyces lushanensis]|uniref:ABC transporter ATP-binding protein n=1 Tax=Streptomyces lushanensis TaxID=1434255 RepID=UPI00082FCE84|nr:ABC transporter ATP-binding protein [Streptomyces lushanensis]
MSRPAPSTSSSRPAPASRSVPSTSALAVTELTVRYPGAAGPLLAVDQVTLTVEPGGALVLVGESGSGKTTVARTVLGLPGHGAEVTGRVQVDGTDLRPPDERALSRIRGRRIGYVPQDPTGSLDPLRRIGSQLTEVLLRHGIATGRGAARAAVPGLLERAGIDEPDRIARSYPHELSGGLRQRAAIALAVSCVPGLLVADEPTTALDAVVRSQILDLFASLRAVHGIALLMVTHDLIAARRIGGRVAVMRGGRIVESGDAEQVLTRPRHPYAAELVAAGAGGHR